MRGSTVRVKDLWRHFQERASSILWQSVKRVAPKSVQNAWRHLGWPFALRRQLFTLSGRLRLFTLTSQIWYLIKKLTKSVFFFKSDKFYANVLSQWLRPVSAQIAYLTYRRCEPEKWCEIARIGNLAYWFCVRFQIMTIATIQRHVT